MNILLPCCLKSQSALLTEQTNHDRLRPIAFLVVAAALTFFGTLSYFQVGHFASLGSISLYLAYGSFLAAFMSMIMAVLCIPRNAPVIYVQPDVQHEKSPQKYRQLNLRLQSYSHDNAFGYDEKFGISQLQFFQRILLFPNLDEERSLEIARLFLNELTLFAEHANQAQVIRYLKYFDDATIEMLKRLAQPGRLHDYIVAAKDDAFRKTLDDLKAAEQINEEDDIIVPAVENEDSLFHALAESLSVALRGEVKLEDVRAEFRDPDSNESVQEDLNSMMQKHELMATFINPRENPKIQELGRGFENKLKILIYGGFWIPILSLADLNK